MLDLEKVESPFSLLGCTIDELNLKNHLVFLGNNTKQECMLNIDVSHANHEKEDHVYFGIVKLTIKVVLITENDPVQDTMSMIIEGGFSAPEDIGKEQFLKLLTINGASMLYSIARGKIEMITGATFNHGKVTLPVININKYYEEEQKAAQKEQKDEAASQKT